MTEIVVTQADHQAALKHLGWESHADLCYWAKENDIERFDQLEAAFARHRQQAIDEAARVAEAEREKANDYYSKGLGGAEGKSRNEARYQTARDIATAIRKLSTGSDRG